MKQLFRFWLLRIQMWWFGFRGSSVTRERIKNLVAQCDIKSSYPASTVMHEKIRKNATYGKIGSR